MDIQRIKTNEGRVGHIIREVGNLVVPNEGGGAVPYGEFARSFDLKKNIFLNFAHKVH